MTTTNPASWAMQKHKDTNHLYDGKPYEYHLWMVSDIAKMFIHYIPELKRDHVIGACWLHDTIEDCRVTYNDIKQEFGEELAEITYSLTEEKGRNRKERHNAKYWEGIRATPFATFVKLCDRAANIKHSLETKSSMFEKYRKEHDGFRAALHDDCNLGLWSYIESLLNTGNESSRTIPA